MKKFLSYILACCYAFSTILFSLSASATEVQTITVDPTSYIVNGFTWVDSTNTSKTLTLEERGKLTTAAGSHYYNPLKYADGTSRTSAVMTYSYSGADFYYNDDVLFIYDAQPKGHPESFTVDIPVTIPTSGWYNARYVHGIATHSGHFSSLHMTMTNDDIEDDEGFVIGSTFVGGNIPRGSANMNPIDRWYARDMVGRANYIESGDYTIHLTVYQPTQSNYAGKYRLLLDDIRFVPADHIQVGAIGETKIEFEDIDASLASSKATIADNTYVDVSPYASGGKIITDFWSLNRTQYIATIPIDVAQAGTYKWTSVMNKGNAKITLLCDGSAFGSTDAAGEDMSQDGGYISSSYPMQKYSGTVNLSAGEHIIELKVSGHSRPTFFADYLTLEAGRVDITGAKTIELEDYVSQFTPTNTDSDNGVKSVDGASAGTVMGTTNGNVNGKSVVYSIPVNVKNAGYYDTEFITSIVNGSIGSRSVIHFTVDDEFFGHNVQINHNGQIALSSLYNGYHNLYKFKGETIYLSEGNHTIKMHVRICASNANSVTSGTVKFSADSLTLTPATRVVIPTNEKKIFELESYNNQLIVNNENASGKKMLFQSWHNSPADRQDIMTVPITISEKGFYKFESVLSRAGGAVSKGTLTLDGVQILSSSDSGIDISKNNTFVDTTFPMHRYENTLLLDEGDYTLQLSETRAQASNDIWLYKFGADYVSIEKIDPGNKIIQEDNNLILNKSIGENVTGKAYASLYLGGQLVDTYEQNVTNECSVLFELPDITWKNYDRASVYVWDSTLNPLSKAYTYSSLPLNKDPFGGDSEINIVFIGDSLYEAYGVTESHKFSTQVGEWFKKTYEDEDTDVNYYNKGVGGTTSEYSLVRLARDVIALNPDVVFFGTTINDGSRDTTRNMESVIRTLQAMENPPYIIMTRFPNSNFVGVPAYGQTLAAHYGIPFIDATDAFQRIVDTGVAMPSLFKDGTHPNDDGHDIISNEIIDRIETSRYFQKGTNDTPKYLATSGIIDPASMDYFSILDERVTRSSGWTVGQNHLHSTAAGDTLEFTFEGNILAFNYGLHQDSAKLEVYVDDELKFTCNPYYGGLTSYQKVCKGDSAYFDLPDGEHKVVMKTVKSNSNSASPQVFRIYDIITGSWAD